MLIDTLMIASLYATMKFVTQNIASSYAVFFYKFSLLFLTLPWVLSRGGINNIKTPAFKVHMLRGFLSAGGSLSFMYGLQHVALLDATILQNFEQVILVIIGILFFHEQFNKTKVAAIITSFIGVLIVIKPEIIYSWNLNIFSTEINHGYFFVFLATIFWVGNSIVVKKLGQKSTNKAQVFYLMLFSSLFSYPVAFLEWQMADVAGIHLLLPVKAISFFEIGLKIEYFQFILLASLFYLVHSITLFHSFRFGEFSVVMPFVYFRLLWAGLLGYFIFSTLPQFGSIIGYILITIAGIVLMRREVRNRKKMAEVEEAC